MKGWIGLNKSLSALKFIKNNKKRTTVLVVSISFFIMMLYSVSYLLGGCYEPFYKLCIEQNEKVQTISFLENVSQEEIDELVNKLKELDNVEYAFSSDIMSTTLRATVGQYGFVSPYTNTENIQKYLDYKGFNIIEGRIPKNPFELIFSQKLLKNAGYKVGDTVGSANFKIVGVFDGDDYYCLGYADGDNSNGTCIVIFSDGKDVDYQKVMTSLGCNKKINVDDYVSGKKSYQKDVVNAIEPSEKLITIASSIVLFICLIVVLSMYIKDRNQEWCLYRSIGFSSKDIFMLANRELLITFITSIILGTILSILSVLIIYLLMINPNGLISTAFMPDVIIQSGIIIFLLYALCQIPIFFNLGKIKTIDAIEDDEF